MYNRQLQKKIESRMSFQACRENAWDKEYIK